MSEVFEFTNLQRLAYLLRNLRLPERQRMTQVLQGNTSVQIDSSAVEVMQACRRVLNTVASAEERQYLLCHAGEVAALLEHQRAQDAKRYSTVKVVATVPRYLIIGSSDPVPHFFGTLTNDVIDIVSTTRSRLDIIVPYISRSGASIYTKGIESAARPGLQVRVLTQLMTHYIEQNFMGILALYRAFTAVGAEVDIRSPTDEQARVSKVLALIHDKKIIGDHLAAQLTANISRSAFEEGYEGGVVFAGPVVDDMRKQFDWAFNRHTPVDLNFLRDEYQRLSPR